MSAHQIWACIPIWPESEAIQRNLSAWGPFKLNPRSQSRRSLGPAGLSQSSTCKDVTSRATLMAHHKFARKSRTPLLLCESTVDLLLQGIKLIDFDDFMQQGFQKPGEALPPKPMDLACIQYTSGTTGQLAGSTSFCASQTFPSAYHI